MANNLVFHDRFNGTITDNWTLDQTGGTVSIVTQDFSNKMKLDDTSASTNVSAVHSFTEPSSQWIFEFDMQVVASGGIGVMELLDSSDTVIATCSVGATVNKIDFSTDTVGATQATFDWGGYKQVVLVVDNSGNTISCYLSGSDGTNDTIAIIGSAKAYSGTSVAKIKFRTDNTAIGIIYVDEVRVYTPEVFIIGHSIADGKLNWSNHPGYVTGRASALEDETTAPAYKMSGHYGGVSTTWVGNRSFGGSVVANIDSQIQATVLDHGATSVIVFIGWNDFGITAFSSMKTSIDSIITKIKAAGITGSNIILVGSYRDTIISTDTDIIPWNDYIKGIAVTEGAVYVNTHPSLGGSRATDLYRDDGIHLNDAGNIILARNIYEAIQADAYTSSNILHAINSNNLYPAAYIVRATVGTSTGNATIVGVGTSVFTTIGSITGTSTVSGISGNILATTGISTGTSVVTGASLSFSTTVGTSAGSSTVSGTALSYATTVGTSLGSSSVVANGVGFTAMTGTSSGFTVVTGVSAYHFATVGSVTGTSTVSGVSGNVLATIGSSTGTSTVSGVSLYGLSTVGSSTGLATVSGVSGVIAGVEGSSTGVTTILGIGEDVGSSFTEVDGTSTGTSVASGVGASTNLTVGSSTGAGVVSGVGTAITQTEGSVTGVATTTGVSATLLASVASATGVATTSGVSGATKATDGSSAGTSTVTGAGGDAAVASNWVVVPVIRLDNDLALMRVPA